MTQADEDELKLYKGHYGDPWDKRMKEVSKQESWLLSETLNLFCKTVAKVRSLATPLKSVTLCLEEHMIHINTITLLFINNSVLCS